MGTPKVIMFYEKCRLCLEEPGVSNIFETEELVGDVFSCTGVKVTPSDNLPQKICAKCFKIVTTAKELRLLASKNDALLRSLFENMEINESMSDIESSSQGSHSNKIKNYEATSKFLENTAIHRTGRRSSSQMATQSGDLLIPTSISVRKDLFEPSTVSSSTRVQQKENEGVDTSRRKMVKKVVEVVEYECETCGKHFDSWKKLYLHQRLHNKTMLCPLDICGKKFATKGDLDKHIRTHTGVKPYTCDICEKSFTQQGTLKVHKETVHLNFKF